MDFLTGLLLVIAPATVLGMLPIPQLAPEALVFVRWIGVFVLAVGLSYGLVLLPRRGRGETVWLITSLVRMLVAAFLIVMIVEGSLPKGWALVGLADGIVALVQIAILRAGWWREGHR